MIVGTAGHVDHGKTALVRALTGVQGDRLKEEKARGVTIDLGFAYLPIGEGRVLGFVDMPGHEDFVRTMVAGASGIDFALLVVACDEGIKPQTREHLAILDLMGVSRGLIVLTKADLATSPRIETLAADMHRLVLGASLASLETLAVSARTGAGIGELRDRLIQAAQTASRPAAGRFRLAVDRAFTLAGVGLVATGAVLSGVVRLGDTVIVSPGGIEARLRSLHAQNRAADIGRAGDRCALNLVGRDVSKATVARGDMVIDPALHAPTDRIDARLRLLSSESKPVAAWFPARLHHAAIEVGARVVPLQGGAISPGETADVQLVLEQPIAAAQIDRFLLRDVSARRTIGGGTFIDLRAPARRRRTPERVAERAALSRSDPSEAFAALLAGPPFVANLRAFARDRALTDAEAQAVADGFFVVEGDGAIFALTQDRWSGLAQEIARLLAAHHAENPDLQGLGRERLRLAQETRWPEPFFKAALRRLARNGVVVEEGGFVRLPDHTAHLSSADEIAWSEIAPKLDGVERFRPPRVRDIAGALGQDESDIRRLLKLAARLGRVDEIARDHFSLRATTREMIAILVVLARDQPPFSAAQFRDRVDNGRKVAIQILEFFDRHGLTLRRGDLRRLNSHRLDLFGGPMLSS
jgi:selenocysteine-specific elongation factor